MMSQSHRISSAYGGGLQNLKIGLFLIHRFIGDMNGDMYGDGDGLIEGYGWIDGWIWMDLDGFGWIWMDLDGFGWIWMRDGARSEERERQKEEERERE